MISTNRNATALLTIKDLPLMTEEDRKQIANWLRVLAFNVKNNSNLYSKKFTARYHL